MNPPSHFQTLILAALLSSFGFAAENPNDHRFGIDLSPKPDSLALGAFQVCVLRPDCEVGLEALHNLGISCLAQVDLTHITLGTEDAKAAEDLGIPLLKTAEPGRVKLSVTHPQWPSWVLHSLTEQPAERGFDGFVLAGLEQVGGPEERQAALGAITALRARFPDKRLILRDSPALVLEARRDISGVLLSGGDPAALTEKARESTRLGLVTYVVALVPGDPTGTGGLMPCAEIEAAASAIAEAGGTPFFTNPEQTGANYGPLKEIRRRILVLHSGAARDSFTAQVLHGALQSLGYAVHYRRFAGEGARGADFHGVVLDQSLSLTPAQQMELAELAADWVEKKLPLLLTGIPWDQPEPLSLAARAFGWQGSGQPVNAPRAALHRFSREALLESGAVVPRPADLRDLRAPESARVLLSIKSADAPGTIFDAAYLAPWGGLLVDSLAPLAGPQISPRFFLDQWLAGRDAAPVMEVAAINGSRVWLTSVGGEGFAKTAGTKGLPMAAEVMRGRVLERFPMPCTVSLCEGDLRGWTPETDPRDELRYRAAARAILSMPQVDAASESLSRPVDWSPLTFKRGPLGAEALETRGEVEREVAGSMSFIHRQTLPKGRKVGAMVWPAGARPSPEAAAFCARLGLPSLESIVPSVLPGRQALPSPWYWTNGATGHALTVDHRRGVRLSASRMIAEFERGGFSAPLHVALRFADAAGEESLREVEALLDWCAKQPLHAMSAGEFSRMAADAAETRIFRVNDGHWLIINRGRARTLRLDPAAGVPDMGRSSGIAGYAVIAGQLYIHTMGRERTELVMRPNPSGNTLHLASAGGSLEILEMTARRATVRVRDWHPVTVVFAGLPARSACLVRTDSTNQQLQADAKGRLELVLPAGAIASLQPQPPIHAALR